MLLLVEVVTFLSPPMQVFIDCVSSNKDAHYGKPVHRAGIFGSQMEIDYYICGNEFLFSAQELEQLKLRHEPPISSFGMNNKVMLRLYSG